MLSFSWCMMRRKRRDDESDDVIVKANNKTFAAPTDFSEFVRGHTVGEIVTLLIKSVQGQRVVEVKLGQRPKE